ncbi:MAG: putative 2OG-Fe(II) oxygenase [Planctomycetota bacterium]|nr:putative 2OG-Fe(II) oxygenase [Planctomycetota bacterium]
MTMYNVSNGVGAPLAGAGTGVAVGARGGTTPMGGGMGHDHAAQATPNDEVRGLYGGQPGEFELVPRNYWATTIFQRKYRDHERDAQAIIDHLYQIKAGETANIASGVAPVMKSKEGLFESKFDLFTETTCPELKRLVAFIESSVRRAVWHVNGREVDLARIQVKFLDSWFHITNNSGFHDAHYHGGCSWCGVYYLQISDVAPPGKLEHAPNGVNRFYAPRGCGGVLTDYGNSYIGKGHLDVPPIPGTLVLFPAYLLHSGLPYKGEKDRVILSFNSTSTLAPLTEDQPR